MRFCASLVLVVSLAVWAYQLSQGDGLVDSGGHPVGGDYVTFYAASALVEDGRPGDVYDLAAIHAAETEALGDDGEHFAWHYPPVFLLAVAGLALLPYVAAFVLWSGATLALLYAGTRSLLRDNVVLAAAIGFPGLYTNLIGGQTGFLSAGILALGLTQLEKRPFLAGAILGAIVYKPHFAPLVFLVLLATNRRAAFAGATTSALTLVVLSLVLFGAGTWRAFIEDVPFASDLLYEGNINLLEDDHGQRGVYPNRPATTADSVRAGRGFDRSSRLRRRNMAIGRTRAPQIRGAVLRDHARRALCLQLRPRGHGPRPALPRPRVSSDRLATMGGRGDRLRLGRTHVDGHACSVSGLVLMPVVLAGLLLVVSCRARSLLHQPSDRASQSLPLAA